ncbi:ABC transporter permease [Patescibacteria group bacterium]|nr:ABC transporter permease [Patescibacteria group bacterium]
MPPKGLCISYYTILRKAVVRIVRIWPQTLLPSVVNSLLYYLVFGAIIGSQLSPINGYSYIAFVVPGIVMLAVITNAYTEVATTFFTSKFFSRNIDEILVSPTPPWLIVSGFVSAGVIRAAVVGTLVLGVSIAFALPTVLHPLVTLSFLCIAAILFSLLGLVNGIYAKNFDAISIVPTFVLTPLIYLGGVFYSVAALPPFFAALTYFNPLFYLINGFRYGFLGVADVSLGVAYGVLLALTAVAFGIAWYLLKTGLGLKQ